MSAAPIPKVLLSQIGDPNAFGAALAAHRDALTAHRVGKAGVPAPRSSDLIESLVARVPATGPVATRGPDTFQIAPWELVDDTPPPPTLAERKATFLSELYVAANATRDAILSPARANLLNLSAGEAMAVPEESRTPAEAATIAAFVAFSSRATEINHNAAVAAVEIEDLDAAGADTWKTPSL